AGTPLRAVNREIDVRVTWPTLHVHVAADPNSRFDGGAERLDDAWIALCRCQCTAIDVRRFDRAKHDQDDSGDACDAEDDDGGAADESPLQAAAALLLLR